MSKAVENAALTFVRAWQENDPAVRKQLVESCFAENGRMLTTRRTIRGPAELLEFIAGIRSDPKIEVIRFGSRIDTGDSIFRYYGIVDFHDGTSGEAFDCGEVGADGRIVLVMSFPGWLERSH